MTICLECGTHTPDRIAQGQLAVQLDPPLAEWKGEYLKLTTPQVRILHKLCRSKQAAHFALELVGIGEDAVIGTLRAQVTKIRQRLPPEVRIKSIYGFGYALEIDDD